MLKLLKDFVSEIKFSYRENPVGAVSISIHASYVKVDSF